MTHSLSAVSIDLHADAESASPFGQQPVDQIPRGHNILIFTKCRNVDEAGFYISQTLEQGKGFAFIGRQYGDSRIRAPFKERHERDVLRVKGGATDYCVIGEINIHALREFQSSYRSSAKGFKPVPDGFAADMAFDRKVLPKGE